MNNHQLFRCRDDMFFQNPVNLGIPAEQSVLHHEQTITSHNKNARTNPPDRRVFFCPNVQFKIFSHDIAIPYQSALQIFYAHDSEIHHASQSFPHFIETLGNPSASS
ncbi:hypothetical protein J2847_001438 [Azospirillum agricola]|uniref:hypothetical protein n=1 Tax=Azospirillum agricola TaxID=1720247 RepID=UPI001AE34CA6|nr:hypothetical protein [Azospirillum agricola]MBP2228156.1 hypothetical protein [Azospirillum agricola]